MRVPGRARPRLEADAPRADTGGRRRLDDRVLPHHAGERFLWLAARRHRAARFDVHGFLHCFTIMIANHGVTPQGAVSCPLESPEFVVRVTAVTPGSP